MRTSGVKWLDNLTTTRAVANNMHTATVHNYSNRDKGMTLWRIELASIASTKWRCGQCTYRGHMVDQIAMVGNSEKQPIHPGGKSGAHPDPDKVCTCSTFIASHRYALCVRDSV